MRTDKLHVSIPVLLPNILSLTNLSLSGIKDNTDRLFNPNTETAVMHQGYDRLHFLVNRYGCIRAPLVLLIGWAGPCSSLVSFFRIGSLLSWSDTVFKPIRIAVSYTSLQSRHSKESSNYSASMFDFRKTWYFEVIFFSLITHLSYCYILWNFILYVRLTGKVMEKLISGISNPFLWFKQFL